LRSLWFLLHGCHLGVSKAIFDGSGDGNPRESVFKKKPIQEKNYAGPDSAKRRHKTIKVPRKYLTCRYQRKERIVHGRMHLNNKRMLYERLG